MKAAEHCLHRDLVRGLPGLVVVNGDAGLELDEPVEVGAADEISAPAEVDPLLELRLEVEVEGPARRQRAYVSLEEPLQRLEPLASEQREEPAEPRVGWARRLLELLAPESADPLEGLLRRAASRHQEPIPPEPLVEPRERVVRGLAEETLLDPVRDRLRLELPEAQDVAEEKGQRAPRQPLESGGEEHAPGLDADTGLAVEGSIARSEALDDLDAAQRGAPGDVRERERLRGQAGRLGPAPGERRGRRRSLGRREETDPRRLREPARLLARVSRDVLGAEGVPGIVREERGDVRAPGVHTRDLAERARALLLPPLVLRALVGDAE